MEENESDNNKSHGSDDFPYLEGLQLLKEINEQQRLLSRTEIQLERCHDNYHECHVLTERYSCEVQKLKDEKKELIKRVTAIDTDLSKLSDISKQLQQECAKQCSDAPLQEYAQQLASVNSLRQAAQLGPLEECTVYQQLHLASRSGNTEEMLHRPIKMNPSASKAGPSYKLCPSCCRQVSRNAVLCPNCRAPCSKTGKTSSSQL